VFIEKNKSQPTYPLYKNGAPAKVNCPNCNSYCFNLNLENHISTDGLINKIPRVEIKRIKGLGHSFKIIKCKNCNNEYYIGFGYFERQPGLEFQFIHNIINVKFIINKTIASIMENDGNYFEYFKNAINSGANYYEYNFIFGDSASAKLFYLEKSNCTNSVEGLVKLVIPFLYHNGCFRKSNSKEIKSIFETVKKDLKTDIYWNTKIKNGNSKQLKKDLLYFPSGKEISHFEYYKDGKWIETKDDISEIINECLSSAKNIKLTEWNPSFEYFLETTNYYVLYNFSTGV
jgi:hypothetical protein